MITYTLYEISDSDSSAPTSSRFSTLTSRLSSNNQQPRPSAGHAAAPDSRREDANESLSSVEKALGLDGKKITIPSILGRPKIDLPLLYLIFVGVLMYLGGPRAVLPLIAIGYFLATSNRPRQ